MTNTLFILTCWKPYEPVENICQFIEQHLQNVSNGIQYALAVPYPYLEELTHRYSSVNILFGAIEMHSADKDAFTQAVAGKILKKVGAAFVLIGTHQERVMYGLNDTSVHLKILEALKEGVTPILCVGEGLEEHEQGLGGEIIENQLNGALKDIPSDQMRLVTVFFESPWALRLPYKPTTEDLVNEFDRNQKTLEKVVGKELADAMQVIRTIPEDIDDFHPAKCVAVFASHHHVPKISKKASESPAVLEMHPETNGYASVLEEQKSIDPVKNEAQDKAVELQSESEEIVNSVEEEPVSIAEFLAEEEVAVVDGEEDKKTESGLKELEDGDVVEKTKLEEQESRVEPPMGLKLRKKRKDHTVSDINE